MAGPTTINDVDAVGTVGLDVLPYSYQQTEKAETSDQSPEDRKAEAQLSDIATIPVEQQPVQTSRKIASYFGFSALNREPASSKEARHVSIDRLDAHLRGDVWALLQSRPAGLYADEAAAKLQQFGPNATKSQKASTARLLMTAFANPFNVILTVLAIVSIATQDKSTFTVMMAMVLASSLLRFWQERKSAVQAAEIAARITRSVSVLRKDGSVVQASAEENSETPPSTIDPENVVPGDMLLLKAGDTICADAIVVSSVYLQVAMTSLTGESEPVEKHERRITTSEKEVPVKSFGNLISHSSVLLAGCSIATGSCTAIVVNTGNMTYLSSIVHLLSARIPPSSFERNVRKFSYVLIAFMATMSPIVFILQGTINKANGWKNAFLFAIAVAVGLVPEMLPLIVTANLSKGAVALGRKNVIVKRLNGVQNLGCVTVFCTDKTGTITKDAFELSKSVGSDGQQSLLALQLGHLNAGSQGAAATHLDEAIIKSAAQQELAVPQWECVAYKPFDSARRMATAEFRTEGGPVLTICKGAVDEVLSRCTWQVAEGQAQIDARGIEWPVSKCLSPTERASLQGLSSRLNEDGYRLVAVAYRLQKEYDQDSDIQTADVCEQHLVFAGFLAFLDAPKDDAAKAIADLHSMHIKVKVITGDAAAIAVKVGREVGLLPLHGPISPGAVLTGSMLDQIEHSRPDEYRKAVEDAIILAKLSPTQKLDIVNALKALGHVVGMMGDGNNDALALRHADCGISVDTGAEVAKEASDLILLEKSLAAVSIGVVLGRKTLLNTIKYIKMAASSNFGNVFSVMAASVWLPYQPMLAVQLLTQNLLYDFSQSLIPWDNVDADYLEEPVEWSMWSFVRFMIIFGPTSSVFDIVTFSINWWYYDIRTIDSPLVKKAQTNWFLVGLTTQMLVVHVLRSDKVPLLKTKPSLPFFLGTLTVLAVGFTLPYIPGINDVLSFMHPEPLFYAFVLAIDVTYICLTMVVKVGYNRFYTRWL